MKPWIDQNGLFHAGDEPGVYTVRAISMADPTKYCDVLVTVTPPEPKKRPKFTPQRGKRIRK